MLSRKASCARSNASRCILTPIAISIMRRFTSKISERIYNCERQLDLNHPRQAAFGGPAFPKTAAASAQNIRHSGWLTILFLAMSAPFCKNRSPFSLSPRRQCAIARKKKFVGSASPSLCTARFNASIASSMCPARYSANPSVFQTQSTFCEVCNARRASSTASRGRHCA